MAEFDDLQLSHFWDALAAGQPEPSELDRSLADPLRQVHSLFAAPKPGSARERARQRLNDSIHHGEEQQMTASTIPIGFASMNGHSNPIPIPKPPAPIAIRQRPRWAFAAIAAALVVMLGGMGGFFASRGDGLFSTGTTPQAVLQAPQTETSGWSQYRNGPGHTGVTTDLGPEENPGELWTFATGGPINSEAAIADGVAYIGSGDGHLYALDANTGAEQWRFDAGAAVDCGPAVGDGIVYITSRNEELIALSTVDGSELWRVPNANSNSSAVLDDEKLYIPMDDGTIAALDPATGEQRWSVQTGLTTGRTPAYADGVVVAGTEEGTLFAIDAQSGAQLWSFVSDGGLVSTSVIADGTVYQAIRDGDGNGLYVLDLHTGEERWTYHALDNAGVGIPTVEGETVYLTADDGHLTALDASNGVERWIVPGTAPWQADGKIAGDFLYIYHPLDQKLFAFDKATGAVHWELDGVTFENKGPSIAADVLYASTMDGTVHAIAANVPGPVATVEPAATPEATPTGVATLLWQTDGDPNQPLNRPQAIRFAPDGTIWVANAMTSTFEIFSPDGLFIRSWGAEGSGQGQFSFHDNTGGRLGDVGWDADGNIYVFDSYNSRVQKFDPEGNFLLSWGTPGVGDGQMDQPLGVVDAQNGRIYVTGTTQRVDVYDLDGNQIDQFGSFGTGPGQFRDPFGIAVDADGNVYVADNGGERIQVFDRFGNLQTDRGEGGVLASGVGNVFYMQLDAEGRIYAADYLNGRLLVIAPDGTTLFETDQVDGLGDLMSLTGVAVGPDGSVYLSSEQYSWLAKIQLPPID